MREGGKWEQRWHPLRQEWVLVAAHRQNRPWTGETSAHEAQSVPEYDAGCYLCPGNARVSGINNPAYTETFVFDNDHPCVGLDAPVDLPNPGGIYRSRPGTGIARVVCYSPKHNLSLAQLSQSQVEALVQTWQREYRDLSQHPAVNHILMFENRGEIVGVSNPHPHGQIYATNFITKVTETAVAATHQHLQETGRPLFQDILAEELRHGARIIYENEHACVFIPYFGRYAYEVYIAPKVTHPHIAALSDAETANFADALRQTVIKLDNLWQMPFPYIMTLHQAPTDDGDYRAYHFHIEFYPPLRKPNLRKYLAGAELGMGNFLADTVPDEKAAELQAAGDVHYKEV